MDVYLGNVCNLKKETMILLSIVVSHLFLVVCSHFSSILLYMLIKCAYGCVSVHILWKV